MINEPFAEGDSFLHMTDPRYRIVFAALFSITVAMSYRFTPLFFALAGSVILIFVARIDLGIVLKRLRTVIGFILLIWVFLPFTYEGDVIYKLGPLPVTLQGIILAAQISLKSITILLAFIALAATMHVSTLGYSLDRLKVPSKLVHLLLFTYRYIFVIEQEYRRLVRAAKIRGFKPTTSIHSYKTFAYLAGMLFVRASTRADRVYNAMRCRGFKGEFYCLMEFPPNSRNIVFTVCMTVVISALIIMEYI